MSEIAVLGCGPAGLFAAHAVALAGHTPVIFSRKEKSKFAGAILLHDRVEELDLSVIPDLEVHILKYGTAEGYAQKVYGDSSAPTSWNEYSGVIRGWDLREAYDELWETYEGLVKELDITYDLLGSILNNYQMTFSSVPADKICANDAHKFTSKLVYLQHGLDQFNETRGEDNLIYYNGASYGFEWYRYSQIAGHVCWEFTSEPPDSPDMAGYELTRIRKPLDTDCDCWTSYRFRRVGRFGEWKKGVLTHDAYEEARNALFHLL